MSKHVLSIMRKCICMELGKGNILVASAMIMVILFMALAVDLACLHAVRSELQDAADAAALAAAGKIYGSSNSLQTDFYYHPFASNPLFPTVSTLNSVRVRIPIHGERFNGSVPLVLAPVLRAFTADDAAEAVATVEFPMLLPFATSDTKWNSLTLGGDGDNYAYNLGKIKPGPDGTPEIQIFPDDNWNGNGMPPGSFGALHIGGIGGPDVMRRQIEVGPSVSDIACHGGLLRKGMVISGRTGVNGGFESAITGGRADERVFVELLGKTRYLPLYNNVTGSGDDSQFTISQFVAVRMMAVKMTDTSKWIVLQPVTAEKDLVHVQLKR